MIGSAVEAQPTFCTVLLKRFAGYRLHLWQCRFLPEQSHRQQPDFMWRPLGSGVCPRHRIDRQPVIFGVSWKRRGGRNWILKFLAWPSGARSNQNNT